MAYGLAIRRGGSYNRLAEPAWADPLDTSYSRRRGGHWNPPESFGVLYLNRDLRMARLQVQHKLPGHPYGVEDLDESEQHDLVSVDVAERDWLDCVTAPGLEAVGLPPTYPRHRNGRPVRHSDCQPVGQAAFDHGKPGSACRSAAAGAAQTDEELAVFDRGARHGPAHDRQATFRRLVLGRTVVEAAARTAAQCCAAQLRGELIVPGCDRCALSPLLERRGIR